MADPIITPISITAGCIRALVVAFQANAEDWGGALEAGGLGGVALLGQILGKRLSNQEQCCLHEAKQIAPYLEKLIKAERVPDQEAIFANLNDFAPQLLARTRVTPHDLAHIKHGAPLSKGQQCLSIILKRIPDETKFESFRTTGAVERRAFELIVERFYDRLFAAPDPFHELIEAKLDKYDGKLDEILAAVTQNNPETEKVAELEKLLTAEREEKQQLAEALAALGKQNDPSSQEAEDELIAGDPEKAKAFFRERAEAQEGVIGDAGKAAAENYRHLGAIAFLNNTQEALDAYRRATELDPENADGWNRLGHLLRRVGEIDEAMEAYKQVLEIGEKTSNQELIAIASGNLGLLYYTRGDLDDAEKMYKKSLKINEELGKKEGMAAVYGNLGALYYTLGNLDDAEEMHKKSLKINEVLRKKEGMAINYGNLGNLYYTRGNLDDAEEMYKKSLEIDEELGRRQGMASNFGDLGNLNAARGDLDTATSYWTKSLTLAREMGAAPLVQQVESFFTDHDLSIPKD